MTNAAVTIVCHSDRRQGATQGERSGSICKQERPKAGEGPCREGAARTKLICSSAGAALCRVRATKQKSPTSNC